MQAIACDHGQMGVTEGWARLRSWLVRYTPTTHEVLRVGTSETDIGAMERELAVSFPADLREWWACCDGTERGVFAEIFPPFYTPYSAAEALGSWRVWMDVMWDVWGKIEAKPEAGGMAWSWHPAFVPIGFDGCGNDLVVDLRDGDLRGCVLEYDHDDGALSGPIWNDLREMITRIADALINEGMAAHCRPLITSDGRLDWQCH